ncbi:hypothetical protein KKG90_02650 [Candidatus Bipolaricaulota bacterium]|nr:hypothetical protein [Candidatus Bipolaricaulota bacterium]
MGRTILYILIGISVVGALAVMLLITPIDDVNTAIQTTQNAAIAAPETVAPGETAARVTDEPSEAAAVEPMASEPEDEAAPIVEPPIVVGLNYSIDGTIVAGEYPHQMAVAGVDVYWGNDAQQLRVGLVSPGTGYVAIGFDPDRQMEGANFILASMHEGELTIRDDYGHETLAHMEDTARGGQDNILAAAGNEWPDQTVIEFIIPLDSGDVMDKPLLPGHEYTVLLSYHSMADSFSNPHTRRGSGKMQLDLPN